MPFFVYGRDRPGVEAEMDDLVEAHWAYMDRFADRLILRGPTLSDDETEHTGSVHVVDLPDRASADRFATEEPFWQAGLYEQVTTARAVVVLHREAAGGHATDAPSALITGAWPAASRSAGDTGARLIGAGPDSRLSFVAVLVDDDQARSTGIVSVVRDLPGEGLKIIQPIADRLAGAPASLTAQRWRRGGRPQ